MVLKNKRLPQRFYYYLLNFFVVISLFSLISSRCVSNDQLTQIDWDSIWMEGSVILPNSIIETSGIYYYHGLVWTFNDSGDEPNIYAFSLSKNKIVKQVKLQNATNIDWEAITYDKNYLYVGDIGNNFGNRDTLCVYKIDKKSALEKSQTSVKSAKILFIYPDYQPVSIFTFKRSSFDCEAMVWWNDSLYLFTKDWVTSTTTLYKIPDKPGYYIAQKVSTFNINGLITDACYNGKHLLLLGYKEFQPFLSITQTPNKILLDNAHSKRIELPQMKRAQTEGVAFMNDSTILISAEKSDSDATLWVIKMK